MVRRKEKEKRTSGENFVYKHKTVVQMEGTPVNLVDIHPNRKF